MQSEKLDDLLSSTVIIVGDLILAEILQGFRSDKDYRMAKQLLRELELVSLYPSTFAIKSAENYRLLRKKGFTKKNRGLFHNDILYGEPTAVTLFG